MSSCQSCVAEQGITGGLRSEWRVHASPDGTLTDLGTRKEYPYLFWEADSEDSRLVASFGLDKTKSFCIAGSVAGIHTHFRRAAKDPWGEKLCKSQATRRTRQVRYPNEVGRADIFIFFTLLQPPMLLFQPLPVLVVRAHIISMWQSGTTCPTQERPSGRVESREKYKQSDPSISRPKLRK